MACYPPTGRKTAGPCFARRRVQGEPAMGTRLRNAINIKDFGATGDGTTNDTPAVNAAVVAANTAGGGIVEFPAGRYLAGGSIHLLSNVTFQLDADSVLLGAPAGYDPPEPNPNDAFQNLGHSHFHDAMIWDDNLTNAQLSAGCCNARMFGSETCGVFTGYQFEHITITGGNKSGLGMVSMDGANISDVHYRDITMSGVASPIMQKIGTRRRCGNSPGVGHISNITY